MCRQEEFINRVGWIHYLLFEKEETVTEFFHSRVTA